MKSLFKAIAWTLGLVIVVVVAAPLIAVAVIDQATIKQEAAAWVKENTGRELTISGNIVPTVYPWLGAEVSGVTLGNAAGFQGTHFAKVENASVRVKLMPLLSGNVEMDTVAIDGLDLILERNANKSNWDDLTQVRQTSESAGSSDTQAVGALALGGITLTNSAITWNDETQNQTAELKALNATTEAIDLKSIQIPVTADFIFQANQPELAGKLSVKAVVAQGASANTWSLTGTTLSVDTAGGALRDGKISATLSGDFRIDLDGQMVTFSNSKLHMQDVRMAASKAVGTISVTDGKYEMATGNLSSSGVSADLASFAHQAITGSASVSAALRIDGVKRQVVLADLQAALDASGGPLGENPVRLEAKAQGAAMDLRSSDLAVTDLAANVKSFSFNETSGNFTVNGSINYAGATDSVSSKQIRATGQVANTAAAVKKLPFAVTTPMDFNGKASSVQFSSLDLKLNGFDIDDTKGSVTIKGPARFDIANNRFRSNGIDISGQVSGRAIRGGKTKIALKTPVDARLNEGKVSMGKLNLQLTELATHDIRGKVSVKGAITGDLKANRWSFKGMVLNSDLAGKALPGGKLGGVARGNLNVDLAKQTLSATKFTINTLGIKGNANVTVSQLTSAPVFRGNVSTKTFNVKALLKRLGEKVPRTRRKGALTKVAIKTKFTGSVTSNGTRLSLKPLNLTLDQTNIRGSVSADKIPLGRIRFDLKANGLNLDNYLAPDSHKQAASPGAAAAAASTLPLDTVRSLNLAGNLSIGKFTFADLRTSAVGMSINATDGLVRVHPLKARLYKGAYQGNVTFDARGKLAKISVNENLTRVAIEPLLRDVNGTAPVSGFGNVAIKLTTQGNNQDQLTRGLNGNLGLRVTNGAIKQIDIVRSICFLVGGAGAKGETQFDSMSGNATVVNGVVNNPDLQVVSPLLRIAARGQVDLPRQRMDYRGDVSLVKSCAGQGGKLRGDLSGIDVPVRIAGPLSKPSPSLDIEQLAQRGVTRTIEKQVTRQLEKKLGDQLGKELGGALKGLFGN
ncbi:MAG: AsmA family protein [Gammaproteobacteria bacterium]